MAKLKLGRGFDKTYRRQWGYFEQQFEELLTKYGGEFVAMYNGRVIDHDKDDEELARRMLDDKMGAKRFIIAEVSREPRVYEV